MNFLKSRVYNFLCSLPYKIHPSFHFKIYKLFVNIGLGRIFSDPVVEFIIKHVHKGSCVIDVGANKGTYAYSISRAIGKKGVIYAFDQIQ